MPTFTETDRPPAGPKPSPETLAAFRGLVLAYYAEYGRSFPWRETRDPWRILVSEVMLQQTQTERVLPKYLAWFERFPGPEEAAAASVAEILSQWSGLGYNRRALALARAAREIVESGFPEDEAGLLALPGVGPYTAGAVLAFAFGRPALCIETNIRAAFLHHFFPGEIRVPDSRIAPLVVAALGELDPRHWYYALMDYGVFLKKRIGNPNRRSAHYARQSPFAESHRRLRGELLRELGARPQGLTRVTLVRLLPFSEERIDKALGELLAEGFLEYEGRTLRLAGAGPQGGPGGQKPRRKTEPNET